MKRRIIIPIFVFILLFGSSHLQNISNLNNIVLKPQNKIDEFSKNIYEKIMFLLITILEKFNLSYENMFRKCSDFIFNLIGGSRAIINNYANNIFKAPIVSESIGGEDECLESNNIYALISINFSSNDINQDFRKNSNGTQFFFETLTKEIEICIWKACNLFYDIFEDTFKMVEKDIKKAFGLESIRIEGINYKINSTTLYEDNHKEDNNLNKYEK